jgi:hypothetical protein
LCKNFNTSSPNLRQHTTRNTTKKEAVDRDARTHARTRASPNPNFGVCPNRKRTRRSEISKLPKKRKESISWRTIISFHNWPMEMRVSSTHQWRWGLWGFF